jgi:predicted alpha/beta-hydrolase family hydrolase
MTTTGARAVDTSHGRALVHVHPSAHARGLLVLGHGAGGGVDAPDLVAASGAASELGFDVALVLQPYRAAGRKAPPRAPTLDAAWTDVVGALTTDRPGVPLVVGGRSAGARVACRTAVATGAAGVLCLAFPLRPPGRPTAPSRLPELDGAGVPVLVVQGERDPYGIPPAAPGRTVVTVRGDHSLRADLPGLRAAVRAWLAPLVDGPRPPGQGAR